MQKLYSANTDATGGLYPTKWKISTGEPANGESTHLSFTSSSPLILPTDQVSVGTFADSGYEYLLKQYLLSGRTDIQARDACMFRSLDF
jgi:mannosyl-oligosaccharide alpha-1,2-mannosidase